MSQKTTDANAPSTPATVVSIESFRQLAAVQLEPHMFTVPKTGITVKTKGLTMGERSKASKNASKDGGERSGIAFMCWCVHFGMVEPRLTVEELATMPGTVIEPIYEDIMAITLPDEEKEEGGDGAPLAQGNDASSPF